MTKDIVFLALTRPTMKWGVTDTAIMMNGMFSGIAFLATNSLLALMLFMPIHIICVFICKYDPRQFELIASWFLVQGRCINRIMWGASSSSPFPSDRFERRL